MTTPKSPDPCPAPPTTAALAPLWAAAALCLVTACGGGGGDTAAPPVNTPAPPAGSPPAAPVTAPRATVMTSSLNAPWGLAFLPDGRMLVTQKGGSLVVLSAGAASTTAVSGVPAVASSGQGGLLDLAIDPDFPTSPWVYFTYTEAGSGGAGTAVARGRLVGNQLLDVAVIFRQTPKVAGSNHFGSRLAFRTDKTLFVTLGERQQDDPSSPGTLYAQNPSNGLGKVVRIARDGSIPAGNPDFGIGALAGLWSIGHRNPQGAAIHPGTGELWLNEHGPQGGDELNRVAAGENFGWPRRSYGCVYGASYPGNDNSSCRIGGGSHAPTFVEPVTYWGPTSIAPSGLAIYTGAGFPEWQGDALLGALATDQGVWRVDLDGSEPPGREKLAITGLSGERVRVVKQGPDGWLYLLTDSGKLIRVDRP